MSYEILTLTLDKKDVLTVNQRLHHYARASKTKKIREKTLTRTNGIETLATKEHPARLVCRVTQDTKRRFDPPNFYPVFKAMIDGLTDAGAWEDDSKEYITHVTFTYGTWQAPKGTTAFTIEIEELL